jgi:hypothetical protein
VPACPLLRWARSAAGCICLCQAPGKTLLAAVLSCMCGTSCVVVGRRHGTQPIPAHSPAHRTPE